MDPIGLPSKRTTLKHSTDQPSGGRGEMATSCHRGNFHVVRRDQISEALYTVHGLVVATIATAAARVSDASWTETEVWPWGTKIQGPRGHCSK